MATFAQPVHEIQPEINIYHRQIPDGEVFDWHKLEKYVVEKKGAQLKDINTKILPFKVIFIVHGFYTHNNASWMKKMKDALLEVNKDSWVYLVGWGKTYGRGSRGVSYDTAVANIPLVGEFLGNVARTLKEDLPNIYIHGIGHSLGAHLLGFAGRTSRAFDRITGLDPAGPRFGPKSNNLKGLSSADATEVVDVIHTDGKTLGFGTIKPMGTIDFYPNNGKHQPGKPGLTKSHTRACKLFTWSILHPGVFSTNIQLRKETIVPRKDPMHICSARMEEMGYHCACTLREGGCYYIQTTGEPPWVEHG